jgi:hypothetical protein
MVDLLGVDPLTGKERGRWSEGLDGDDLELEEGVLVGRSADSLVGVDPSVLVELWRLPLGGYPKLVRDGDRLLAERSDCSTGEEMRPVDPRTGVLGDPLPAREPTSIIDTDDAWELQLAGRTDTASTLRRNDTATGKPLWTVKIPGYREAWARLGDQLLVHAKPNVGRGFFPVHRWATGTIEKTACGVTGPARADGDRVIARCGGDGVIAFSAVEFGPPEAETRPVAAEVRRILEAVADNIPSTSDDAVAELRTLGSNAVPEVVAPLPSLPDLEARGRGKVTLTLAPSGSAAARRPAGDHAGDLAGPRRGPGGGRAASTPAALGGPGGRGGGTVLVDSRRASGQRFEALTTLRDDRHYRGVARD